MIKAIQLRLGNLFKYKNRIETVDSIDEYYVNAPGGNEGYKPNEINGIPLTEQWLLKFGFQRLTNSWIIDNGSRNEHGDVIIGINTFSLYDFSYGDCTKLTYNQTKVHHVHQLQNLYFALTGEELTIKTI